MEKEHLFVCDCERDPKIKFEVSKKDLLLDFKFLIKEYYVCTFTEEDKSLILRFNNGQKFQIRIKEVS